MMITKSVLEKVKDGLIIIALGAVVSIIPFYFQTRSMIQENQSNDVEQFELIGVYQKRLHELEIKGAVDKTEIEQIKASLNRIEGKIDRLIEGDK